MSERSRDGAAGATVVPESEIADALDTHPDGDLRQRVPLRCGRGRSPDAPLVPQVFLPFPQCALRMIAAQFASRLES